MSQGPHDAFFKAVFSDPENAVGELMTASSPSATSLEVLERDERAVMARPDRGAEGVRDVEREIREDLATAMDLFRQQGEARGILLGAQRVLLRQLRARFGPLPIADEQRVMATTNQEVLEGWAERLLTAAAVSEVLESGLTTAERLRRKGEVLGVLRGQRRLLGHQLRSRFGQLSVAAVQRINDGDESLLAVWAERVLTAASIEAVIGDTGTQPA